MSQIAHNLPSQEIHDFTAIDPSKEDDYGIKCRVVKIADHRWDLRTKSGKNYHSIGEATFHSPALAERWANQTYRCNGRLTDH